jgi:hypothetical protein
MAIRFGETMVRTYRDPRGCSFQPVALVQPLVLNCYQCNFWCRIQAKDKLRGRDLSTEFTNAELEAYLDESLEASRAAEIEARVRDDEELLRRLSEINGRREAGMHTLGEVWRRNQLGVPTVEQMGNFLLGVLPQGEADYIEFRLETLKCPFSIALKSDLESRNKASSAEQSTARRSKIYNSSAGLLKGSDHEK